MDFEQVYITMHEMLCSHAMIIEAHGHFTKPDAGRAVKWITHVS